MGKKKLLKKSKKHLEQSEDDDSWTTEIKHRRRFSFDELQLLESIFFNNPCPTQNNIQNIAHQLKAPRKNITTWFQNRRAKSKRKEKDLLLSQNDVGFTYPWFDPSFVMNTSMQQQLFQPYHVKNTCWYYQYTPALYVNPSDLMLDQPSSSSSVTNNEVEDQIATNHDNGIHYFPMFSNSNN